MNASALCLKTSIFRALAISACALSLSAARATAQLTFTIQPLTEATSKDAKIFTHDGGNPTQSNLNLTSIDTGEHFLSLVQFDLSSLAGVNANSITSAFFTLYSPGLGPSGVQNPNGGTVTVSPVLDAWRESAAETGTAPLASYPAFFGSTNLSTGVFTPPTLHFGDAVATQSVTSAGFYSWDITSLVKEWVSGSLANDGIIIQLPDSNTNADIGFADVDSSPAIPGSAPSLSVIAVPEPSAFALSLLGAVGLGFLRRRRALLA